MRNLPKIWPVSPFIQGQMNEPSIKVHGFGTIAFVFRIHRKYFTSIWPVENVIKYCFCTTPDFTLSRYVAFYASNVSSIISKHDVLLGSQWVNPCLRSPMHDWAAGALPSQLTTRLSAIRLHRWHIMFHSREWTHVCWIEEKYMVIHIYGITLNTTKSADQYYSSYWQSCIFD